MTTEVMWLWLLLLLLLVRTTTTTTTYSWMTIWIQYMVFRIGFAITTTILGRVGPIRSDYADPYMLLLLLLLLLWRVVGVALIGIVAAMGHDATLWCVVLVVV
jgi:hypothetical protein